MNLVFMNRMEKPSGDHRVITAQVTIEESQGQLYIVWAEPGEQGKLQQDIWYEGTSWEEMMAVFRYRLMEKRGLGFAPVIESMPSIFDRKVAFGQNMWLLYFYSESNGNEPLYNELRTWRRAKASAEGKAPFVIANNRVLQMISAFVPHNAEELSQIPGIGQHKLSLHGSDILAITAKYERNTSFPLDWVQGRVDAGQFERWMYKQKEQKFKAEADALMEKKKALQCIHGGQGLAELQEQLSKPARHVIQLIEQLDEEGYDVVPLVQKEIASYPEKENEQALSAFAKLGDQYLKPVFTQLYGQSELQPADTDERYIRLRLLRLYYRHTGARKQAAV